MLQFTQSNELQICIQTDGSHFEHLIMTSIRMFPIWNATCTLQLVDTLQYIIKFLKIFHICKSRNFDTMCVQNSPSGF